MFFRRIKPQRIDEDDDLQMSMNTSRAKQTEKIFSLNRNELRFCQSEQSASKTITSRLI